VTLEQRIARIAKEARTLAGTADRLVARRNARARVLAALRAVRAHVDAEFPAIVSREGGKRRTIAGRRARLKRQGFVHAAHANIVRYALAGVRVHTLIVRNPQPDGSVYTLREHYVPRWVMVLDNDDVSPTKLRAFIKDRALREAALAAHALRNS
jgi:hypothetical protein